MSESDARLVQDMLAFSRTAKQLFDGVRRDEFERSRLHQYALAYCIQTIGECASRMSPDMREAHPQVEWKRIAGTRHRLVHAYADVDYDLLWVILQDRLPELIEQLERI